MQGCVCTQPPAHSDRSDTGWQRSAELELYELTTITALKAGEESGSDIHKHTHTPRHITSDSLRLGPRESQHHSLWAPVKETEQTDKYVSPNSATC